MLCKSFYTISFEYHRASIRHLGGMNVLAYARIFGSACMRYRTSETDYQYRYRHKWIYGCLLTENKYVLCVCVCVCVRAYVRACVCVCVTYISIGATC